MNSSTSSIQLVFSTREADLELPEDSRVISVPREAKRYELSRILNSESMLGTSHPVPLDFLIHGEFLRGSLSDHLVRCGISSSSGAGAGVGGASEESTVQVVYVRAQVPPQFETSFEHPEWVSSVDLLSSSSPAARWWPTTTFGSSSGGSSGSSEKDERILSASFDGLLRIWTPDGKCVATTPPADQGGHRFPAKAARFLSPTRIASGGFDRTVRVWEYSEDSTTTPGLVSGSLRPTLVLRGHVGHVTTLCVRGDKSRILTADSEGSVGLWTSSKESAPAAPEEPVEPSHLSSAAKRRKISSGGNMVPTKGPLSMTSHHAGQAVACFDAGDPTVGYSAADDGLVRTLDLTASSSASVSSVQLTSPVFSLLSLGGSMAPLVAAGTKSRRVVLVDPRESTSARTSVLTLKGHGNWVSCLAQSPDNDYILASGSYDGTVMVWDLRAGRSSAAAGDGDDGGLGGLVAKPVYVVDRESLSGKKRPLAGEGIKVFGLAWDRKWGLVSGGEDKKVQVDKWRTA